MNRANLLSAIGSLGLTPLVPQLNETRRYPEWRSKRKTKGAKDKSLNSRSNRRKAERLK